MFRKHWSVIPRLSGAAGQLLGFSQILYHFWPALGCMEIVLLLPTAWRGGNREKLTKAHPLPAPHHKLYTWCEISEDVWSFAVHLVSQAPSGNGGTGLVGADKYLTTSSSGWIGRAFADFQRVTLSLTTADFQLPKWYQHTHKTPKHLTIGSWKLGQGRSGTLRHRFPRFQSPQAYPRSLSP